QAARLPLPGPRDHQGHAVRPRPGVDRPLAGRRRDRRPPRERSPEDRPRRQRHRSGLISVNMPEFPPGPFDSGPLIEGTDTGAALLPDAGAGAPWWAPAPELVPAAEGTFRFLFWVTGHDGDGSPTIAATVTAVLRFPPPGQAGARPVTRTSLAV